MPQKPIKYGFKIYMLADSEDGYVFSYIPQTQDNSKDNKPEFIIPKLNLRISQ